MPSASRIDDGHHIIALAGRLILHNVVIQDRHRHCPAWNPAAIILLIKLTARCTELRRWRHRPQDVGLDRCWHMHGEDLRFLAGCAGGLNRALRPFDRNQLVQAEQWLILTLEASFDRIRGSAEPLPVSGRQIRQARHPHAPQLQNRCRLRSSVPRRRLLR